MRCKRVLFPYYQIRLIRASNKNIDSPIFMLLNPPKNVYATQTYGAVVLRTYRVIALCSERLALLATARPRRNFSSCTAVQLREENLQQRKCMKGGRIQWRHAPLHQEQVARNRPQCNFLLHRLTHPTTTAAVEEAPMQVPLRFYSS